MDKAEQTVITNNENKSNNFKDKSNKQIEEIVKDFCPLYQEYGSCKRCNNDLDIDDEPCYYGYVANIIIDYGYRKASEVAREIFEEIRTLLYLNALQGDVFTGRYFSEELETDIAELKKKYTEEEK